MQVHVGACTVVLALFVSSCVCAHMSAADVWICIYMYICACIHIQGCIFIYVSCLCCLCLVCCFSCGLACRCPACVACVCSAVFHWAGMQVHVGACIIVCVFSFVSGFVCAHMAAVGICVCVCVSCALFLVFC